MNEEIRAEFPILGKETYLNSAFTGLTPLSVSRKLYKFYKNEKYSPTGNNEQLNSRVKQAYQSMANFIGSTDTSGIVFTKCATEAITHVSRGLRVNWKPMHNIIVSEIEYASNVLPWLRLEKEEGVEIRVAKLNHGKIDATSILPLIDRHTVLVVVNHVSNILGCVNVIKEIVKVAHHNGALVLVDGAQAVTHIPVNVEDMGCDFYIVSGHKALGPTGSGFLWISKRNIDKIEPLFLGDSGVTIIDSKNFTLHNDYRRFWGGVSDFGGILGLGMAFDYVNRIGMDKIEAHNKNLLSCFLSKIRQDPNIEVISVDKPVGVVTFNCNDNKKVAEHLWKNNINLQLLETKEFPFLYEKLGKENLLRLSVHFYNNMDDINKACSALNEAAGHFNATAVKSGTWLPAISG